MRRAAECQTIVDAVGAIALDWANMGGFNLGPATPVYEFQTSDGTAGVISIDDRLPEDAVSERARDKMLKTGAGLLKHKRRLVFTNEVFDNVCRIGTRQDIVIRTKAKVGDRYKVSV